MRPYGNNPAVDWRRRWQGNGPPSPPAGPRSPWVYVLAAFGGTFLALCVFLALGIGGLLALAGWAGAFDETPRSLTYVNDTLDDVRVYECVGRCDGYQGVFRLAAGDEASFGLVWYGNDAVEWVVVTREDRSYGCIELLQWEDQSIRISSAIACPTDIHSPEANVA